MRLTELSNKPRTLFASRLLLNVDDVREWAKSQGFASTLEDGDMHVTIAFSKEKFDWSDFKPVETKLTLRGGDRTVELFGDDATVLTFRSDKLHERWAEFVDAGASWDFPSYIPHVTISYEGKGLNPKNMKPFTGDLVFGPEILHELDDDWSDNIKEETL